MNDPTPPQSAQRGASRNSSRKRPARVNQPKASKRKASDRIRKNSARAVSQRHHGVGFNKSLNGNLLGIGRISPCGAEPLRFSSTRREITGPASSEARASRVAAICGRPANGVGAFVRSHAASGCVLAPPAAKPLVCGSEALFLGSLALPLPIAGDDVRLFGISAA
jgi:hypothetical protein